MKRVVALVALAAADLGLTLHGFGQGAEEANPIGAFLWAQAGVAGLVLLKAASLLGIFLIVRYSRRRGRRIENATWAWAIGLSTFPVGWNIALLLWVAQ